MMAQTVQRPFSHATQHAISELWFLLSAIHAGRTKRQTGFVAYEYKGAEVDIAAADHDIRHVCQRIHHALALHDGAAFLPTQDTVPFHVFCMQAVESLRPMGESDNEWNIRRAFIAQSFGKMPVPKKIASLALIRQSLSESIRKTPIEFLPEAIVGTLLRAPIKQMRSKDPSELRASLHHMVTGVLAEYPHIKDNLEVGLDALMEEINNNGRYMYLLHDSPSPQSQRTLLI